MSRFLTVQQLNQQLSSLLHQYPFLRDVEIYGWDDGSVNLGGWADVTSLTTSEAAERWAQGAGRTICPDCRGHGEVHLPHLIVKKLSESSRCQRCIGTGLLPRKSTQTGDES